MPYTKQQVYRPENLRFATKSEGREPTLYFRTNHGSGRLRQQHDSGAMAQDIRKHTTHAFFRERAHLDNFHEAARQAYSDGTLTRDRFRELRRDHGGRHTPFQDAFHSEGTFTGHRGSSGLFTYMQGEKAKLGLHRSEGQVVLGRQLEVLRGQTSSIARNLGVF